MVFEVTVTSRGPTVALGAIVMFAVKLDGLLKMSELTVTPAPKDAVAPLRKSLPAIVTDNDAPCAPDAGETDRIVAGRAVTENSPIPVATSDPVVTVTVLGPTTALLSMEMFAVRLVALFTATEWTVTSLPIDTVEAALKVVFDPVMTTDRLLAPCVPTLGATLSI
jgi:hypothetical protein